MPQQRLKIPPATTETHCSPYHFGQQDFSLQAISAAERKKKPNDANDNALRTFLHAWSWAVTKEDETAPASGPFIGCFECPGAYGGL